MADRLPDALIDYEFETQSARDRRRVTHVIHDPDLPPSAPPRLEVWHSDKEPIGRGGQGRVFVQRCTTPGPRLHSCRALKVIRCEDDHGRRRYLRELETMVRFSHEKHAKFFVRMLGYYFSDQKEELCIAMQYFPEGDLSSFLKRHGAFAEPSAQEILSQVLRALSIMHDAGFAHRDIKPQNILIQQRPASDGSGCWWVKLADFGISKKIDGKTTEIRVGTDDYMAPELFDRRVMRPKVNFKAVDMWAVGTVAFYLLSRGSDFKTWRSGLASAEADHVVTLPSGQSISTQGSSFILQATRLNAEKRLTLEAAMRHAWVAHHAPISPIVPTGTDLITGHSSSSSERYSHIKEITTLATRTSDAFQSISHQKTIFEDALADVALIDDDVNDDIEGTLYEDAVAEIPDGDGHLETIPEDADFEGSAPDESVSTNRAAADASATAPLHNGEGKVSSLERTDVEPTSTPGETHHEPRPSASAMPKPQARDGVAPLEKGSPGGQTSRASTEGSSHRDRPDEATNTETKVEDAKSEPQVDEHVQVTSATDTPAQPQNGPPEDKSLPGQPRSQATSAEIPAEIQQDLPGVKKQPVGEGHETSGPDHPAQKPLPGPSPTPNVRRIKKGGAAHKFQNTDIKGQQGHKALYLAAYSGSVQEVRYLLSHGASFKSLDEEARGYTPLQAAAHQGNVDVVKYLLLVLPEELIDYRTIGHTPLTFAAKHGHVDIVRFLVKMGADVEYKDATGKTASAHAADAGHQEIVKLLVGKKENAKLLVAKSDAEGKEEERKHPQPPPKQSSPAQTPAPGMPPPPPPLSGAGASAPEPSTPAPATPMEDNFSTDETAYHSPVEDTRRSTSRRHKGPHLSKSKSFSKSKSKSTSRTKKKDGDFARKIVSWVLT